MMRESSKTKAKCIEKKNEDKMIEGSFTLPKLLAYIFLLLLFVTKMLYVFCIYDFCWLNTVIFHIFLSFILSYFPFGNR